MSGGSTTQYPNIPRCRGVFVSLPSSSAARAARAARGARVRGGVRRLCIGHLEMGGGGGGRRGEGTLGHLLL